MKLKECLLDILFPKYCLGCGKEGLYICKQCELFLAEVNNFGSLTSFWEFNGIVKEAIYNIKYKGMYDIIRELVSKKDFEVAENTIITFVPMFDRKERERNFNQAEIIAEEISRKSGTPVIKMLEKIRKTKDQAKLDKQARLENVKNAFQICAKICDKPGLSQNILLVDDVYTTGATMDECARVLRKAGFKNISYFTLARTV